MACLSAIAAAEPVTAKEHLTYFVNQDKSARSAAVRADGSCSGGQNTAIVSAAEPPVDLSRRDQSTSDCGIAVVNFRATAQRRTAMRIFAALWCAILFFAPSRSGAEIIGDLCSPFDWEFNSPSEVLTVRAFGDDSVDVVGKCKILNVYTAPYKFRWRYDFKSTYFVASNDLADIVTLVLSGQNANNAVADATLILRGLDDKEIRTYSFPNRPWTEIYPGRHVLYQNVLASGDDLLGKLTNEVITGFTLNVSLSKGQVTVGNGEFKWEAGDIRQVPEPSTAMLLLAGALAASMTGIQRRTQRHGIISTIPDTERYSRTEPPDC